MGPPVISLASENVAQETDRHALVVQCPDVKIISDAIAKVKEFYLAHPEIKASHGWEEHVSVVFDHAKKALLSLEYNLPSRVEMEVKLAALLHDVDDTKYFPHASPGTYPNARAILDTVGIKREDESESASSQEQIIKMISWVSCSENGNTVPEEVKESEEYHLLIPRWADRLEAVGAKGVVRCYQYNQEKRRPLWSEESPRPTSEQELWSKYALASKLQDYMDRGGTSADMISHYYDKLLHIARPPKDIVRNPYLEQAAKTSSKDLVDVCLGFGRT
eukprot:CAMPEP_0183299246 /NCGR_PEP_ID=MMETSP0160_2-20130417/6030_1 /TAXON_ID=2839 ORGANISM="Odontella Sinensis, Strain Grunow 1884" /NCGR_SAMPLE_ID=MMETSP0160_2 /ASSEMBLY_ACC=CAM_ASM_000250 /LENGTH=276 /DNA_ID=CAMNT_0025461453 /DNA_START=49 /DNA_END=875 /DNA_ORIENTATION=+